MIWHSVERLVKTIRNGTWGAGCPEERFWEQLGDTLQNFFLPDFLNQISKQVDEIIEINPDLPEPEILTMVTRYMVEFLGALSASVRIYDPNTGQMLSYGSYPYQEKPPGQPISPWRTPLPVTSSKPKRPTSFPVF